MSNFSDVGEFHARFGLPNNEKAPRRLSAEVETFRINFMSEELDEFMRGAVDGDIAQMADALIDLVYVAMGTAHLMGLPWEELWNEVQSANMRKVRAVRAEESKRGTTWDVVKPDGWIAPDIEGVLARY